MFSIGEFARLGGVSARMLRHYDALGLLVPVLVDRTTGYRNYSMVQLSDLNRILGLRELGFSLAEIGELLAEMPVAEVRSRLMDRFAELRADFESTEIALRTIEARLRLLNEEDVVIDDIVIRTLPAKRVVAVARPAPGFGPTNLGPVLRPAREELKAIMDRAGITRNDSPFSFYTGDPDQGTLVAYAAVPVDDDVSEIEPPAQVYVLPAIEEAACVVRAGSVDDVFPQVYVDLAHWLDGNGYVHVGAGRDIYRHIDFDAPATNVYEINFPFRRPGGPTPDVEPKVIVSAHE